MLFSGVDIPIPQCQLIVHQPTLKEISMIGERAFLSGVQILTIDKRLFKDEKGLSNTTNFQIFMTIMNNQESQESKRMVLDALSLIIPNAKVTMTPRSLLLNQNGEMAIIDESNFGYLQDILRQVFCIKNDADEFNTAGDKRAEEIVRKIKKGRAKIAQLKGDDVGSVYARYASSLSIGMRIPLHDLLQYTIYQIKNNNNYSK